MKVSITRRGGYAGLEQRLGEADSAGSDQTALLKSLEVLAAQPMSEGADQFEYTIEVTEPGKAGRTITVKDMGDPETPEMKALAALANALHIPL